MSISTPGDTTATWTLEQTRKSLVNDQVRVLRHAASIQRQIDEIDAALAKLRQAQIGTFGGEAQCATAEPQNLKDYVR